MTNQNSEGKKIYISKLCDRCKLKNGIGIIQNTDKTDPFVWTCEDCIKVGEREKLITSFDMC